MKAELKDIQRLIKDLDSSPIAHHVTAKIQYFNEPKIDDLITMTFKGNPKIERALKQSNEKQIAAAAAAGIESPTLLEFLLKLKMLVKAQVKKGTNFETTIISEIQGPWKMALVEAGLQREGLIEEEIDNLEPIQKPYIRLRDIFKPFPPMEEDKIIQKLEAFLGPEIAQVIIDRKRSDEKSHPNVYQFIYAAKDPFPMASVVIAPPNPELGIHGDSWACYPPQPEWSRIYFGVPYAPYEGVIFVSLYYVIDVYEG